MMPGLTRSGPVHFSDNVGHAGFVAHVGCEVAGLGWVIFGEGLDLATMSLAALSWQESQGSVTWGRKLPVRLHIGTHNKLSWRTLEHVYYTEREITQISNLPSPLWKARKKRKTHVKVIAIGEGLGMRRT